MLDYKAIGSRIASFRKASHFTQAKLAELLGISESYLSQIECGKVKVSLKRLSNIAEIFNTDITSLLADSDPNSRNYGCSQIINIVKDWSPESKRLLIKLLACVNEEMQNKDK